MTEINSDIYYYMHSGVLTLKNATDTSHNSCPQGSSNLMEELWTLKIVNNVKMSDTGRQCC